jgi:hypothetical protein
MDEPILELEQKIERCRRLASCMTDDEVRDALEKLAGEYEAKLPRQRRPFMLGPGAGEP